jgi:hypothetical protein
MPGSQDTAARCPEKIPAAGNKGSRFIAGKPAGAEEFLLQRQGRNARIPGGPYLGQGNRMAAPGDDQDRPPVRF